MPGSDPGQRGVMLWGRGETTPPPPAAGWPRAHSWPLPPGTQPSSHPHTAARQAAALLTLSGALTRSRSGQGAVNPQAPHLRRGWAGQAGPPGTCHRCPEPWPVPSQAGTPGAGPGAGQRGRALGSGAGPRQGCERGHGMEGVPGVSASPSSWSGTGKAARFQPAGRRDCGDFLSPRRPPRAAKPGHRALCSGPTAQWPDS